MDEQRLQAYLTLIGIFYYSYDNEHELTATLEANSELVDDGLLEVIQQYAASMRQEGNEAAANRLLSLSKYIRLRVALERKRTLRLCSLSSIYSSDSVLYLVVLSCINTHLMSAQ